MSFQIAEVKEDADFAKLITVEWASFEQPYCRLRPLFFPIHGHTPEARATAIKESIERQLQWHRADPTSHWIKAVDSETGRIAGAGCWHIYEENPYAQSSDEECTWYPEGEGREMANSLMGQFVTPRIKYMAKPHVFLDIFFVHPDYRRRGIGKLLMTWGHGKADALGFESYLDATEAGVPLYEACGYVKAPRIDFEASKPEPSQTWKELQDALLPFSFWPMWRPVRGRFEQDTAAPWDQGT